MTTSSEQTSDRHPSHGYFPIRTVASMTGVKAVTLRAWEARYGILRPYRAPSGHRFYSRDDIECIQRIMALMSEGMTISQVSHALKTHGPHAVQGRERWDDFIDDLSSAIVAFDELTLDDVYNDCLALYPINIVTERIIIPLLRRLGERWEKNKDGIAEEHFFSVYLRNKLGAKFHHRQLHPHGRHLLMACLPGENHELGLLLFAAFAHDHGHWITLLGANTPLESIPNAANQSGAEAVVLSSAVDPPDEVWEKKLPLLTTAMSIPVFIGGACVASHYRTIVAAGASPLPGDFKQSMNVLNGSFAEYHEVRGDGD